MPHRRPYKQWKHLQDAVCSMELEPIAYILADIGIDVTPDDVNYAAQIMKKHLAVDACNIQDEHDFKASFAEHLNALGSDITGAADISKRPDWNELYSTIVAKVAERADIRRVRAEVYSPSRDNVNIDPYIFLPLYWGARDRGEESFMYEGREWLVAYAFYVVETAGWADVTPEELSQGDDYPGPAHYTDLDGEPLKSHMHMDYDGGPVRDNPHREDDYKDVRYFTSLGIQGWNISEITKILQSKTPRQLARLTMYDIAVEMAELGWGQVHGEDIWRAATELGITLQNMGPEPPYQTPSHYTAKTPEGALEAMERRLSGGFSQQMSEALAQMELKVGELAEAISRMGTSVPAPIVEAAEAVEEAVEVVEAVATGRRPRAQSKAQAIRDHIVGLGERAGQENVSTVVAALQSSFPDITERDVTNAIRTLPGGSPLGRKPTTRYLSPDIEPVIPPPSTRPPPSFRGSPRTQAIRAYAFEQGQGLANISSSDIVATLRGQWPDITSQHVLEAISVDWRTAFGLPALKAAVRGGPTGSRGTSMLDFIARQPRPERRYGV